MLFPRLFPLKTLNLKQPIRLGTVAIFFTVTWTNDIATPLKLNRNLQPFYMPTPGTASWISLEDNNHATCDQFYSILRDLPITPVLILFPKQNCRSRGRTCCGILGGMLLWWEFSRIIQLSSPSFANFLGIEWENKIDSKHKQTPVSFHSYTLRGKNGYTLNLVYRNDDVFATGLQIALVCSPISNFLW